MQAPTQKAFEEFIGLTQQLPERVEQKLGHGWLETNTFSTDRDLVRKVLLATFEALNEIRNDLAASDVGKWLEQPSAQRAFLRLRGERKKKERDPTTRDEIIAHADESFDRWTRRRTAKDFHLYQVTEAGDYGELLTRALTADEIDEKLERMNEGWEIERRVEGHLRRLTSGHRTLKYDHGVAAAFLGYFYTDAHKRHSVKARTRQEAARKLLSAIAAINDQRLWQESGVSMQGFPSWGKSRREMTTESLKQSLHSAAKPLIKKMDATAPERALIYELWSLFHPVNGKGFVEVNAAVYHFANMTGVRNPPATPDAVGDMIKSWEADGITPRKHDRLS